MKKAFVFQFSKQAEKFLAKTPLISKDEVKEALAKAIAMLEKESSVSIDVKPLHGEYKGYYRLRKGILRVVFRYENNTLIIVSVLSVGTRGSIY
jgi:mRNA interferase RelE/StbE